MYGIPYGSPQRPRQRCGIGEVTYPAGLAVDGKSADEEAGFDFHGECEHGGWLLEVFTRCWRAME